MEHEDTCVSVRRWRTRPRAARQLSRLPWSLGRLLSLVVGRWLRNGRFETFWRVQDVVQCYSLPRSPPWSGCSMNGSMNLNLKQMGPKPYKTHNGHWKFRQKKPEENWRVGRGWRRFSAVLDGEREDDPWSDVDEQPASECGRRKSTTAPRMTTNTWQNISSLTLGMQPSSKWTTKKMNYQEN